LGFSIPVSDLPKEDFINTWHSISYLYPGLHPDDYDSPDGGWPRVLKPFAVEAWARFESGELNDAELYPAEAAWCRIYDEMGRKPTEAEKVRRALSSALHGLPA